MWKVTQIYFADKEERDEKLLIIVTVFQSFCIQNIRFIKQIFLTR